MGCATSEWMVQKLDADDLNTLVRKLDSGVPVGALHRVAKNFGAPGITVFREHFTKRCVCDWSSCG